MEEDGGWWKGKGRGKEGGVEEVEGLIDTRGSG